MIYTMTLNPALDYVIKLQKLQTGEINRSEKEYIFSGGKGINVSIILKTLDIDSTALGFISGFVGQEIENNIKKHNINTDFVKIDKDNSRINVKIATPFGETAINAGGPSINETDIKALYKKLDNIKNGDTIVLSGSVPKGIKNDIYENICKDLENRDVRIVVDTTGELLLKTLKYHPFLIKPNQYELEEIFNTKISNQDEAIKYAKQLKLEGAQNVLVSMGDEGCILLDKNGYTYKMNALNTDKVINTVGAGDSMVAGFIAGFEIFHDYDKALKMGISAATATSTSMFLATKNEILKIFNQL